VNVDQVLERANTEGRTRIRCGHCGEPIELRAVGRNWLWLTDEDGIECRAAEPPALHLPPGRDS
jgi:hypothetical protein